LHEQQESARAEQTKLENRIQELQSGLTAEAQKVTRLTETLAVEAGRRQEVEQQAAAIARCRGELETELTDSKQEQVRLWQELEVLQRHLQAQQETSRIERLTLEARTSQLEAVTHELAAAQRRIEEQTHLRQTLAERLGELERAKAQAAAQAEAAIDDMRVIQSALCARVREMTQQHDAALRRIQELDDQLQVATRKIEARNQEPAALRFAILEAARTELKTEPTPLAP
jgi:chromosome segregation ATPase